MATTTGAAASASSTLQTDRGRVWWIASEAAAHDDPPIGIFRTRYPYIVQFHHLHSCKADIGAGSSGAAGPPVDCVFTLEKATPKGDLFLCAYPNWRSHATSVTRGPQPPLPNDDDGLQVHVSCNAASLAVTVQLSVSPGSSLAWTTRVLLVEPSDQSMLMVGLPPSASVADAAQVRVSPTRAVVGLTVALVKVGASELHPVRVFNF